MEDKKQLTENEILAIILNEYEKNKYDTNNNFFSRFAKAISEVQSNLSNPSK